MLNPSDFDHFPQPKDQTLAIFRGRQVERGQFWADVTALAAHLPDRPYLFNLCENRYLFCICLLAAAVRRQICLLPPSGQIAVIEEMVSDYPGAYLATEKPLQSSIDAFQVSPPIASASASPPAFDWDSPSVIAFTSGSTGRPKPCHHNLKTFAISANMAIQALGLSEQRYLMVSTTPPQHMYGLETSVFWPLFSNLILYDERPFFPEDIRLTIAGTPYPAILTTTPTHLRSLVKAEGCWDNLAGIISATDTLSERLANETAAALGQAPVEIYGSTETLSFACRRPQLDDLWQLYPGARLYRQDNETWLDSPHLTTALALPDRLEIRTEGRFDILGRHQDMIKIGGKRSSLSELNRRLQDIKGVDDGFCFLQAGDAGRLAAVVVSRLDRQTIRQGLQAYLDEVFLPRKIYFVDSIPRNAAGKLTQTAQDKLIAKFTGRL